MKISGFTICRNIIKYDYPIVESINSILPMVDEFVVNIGDSDDNTEELVRSIKSPKIRIIHSLWDESLQKDGLVFSVQTNIALEECSGDWAFYIQPDEVVHENDLSDIKKKIISVDSNPKILGLCFRYLHFYGDYFTVNLWGYHWATRIIRNNRELESCGDAVGFQIKKTGEFIFPKGKYCIPTKKKMYHYGYVKNPKVLMEKSRYLHSRFHGDSLPEKLASSLSKNQFEFDDYDISKEFRGSHPRVMKDRLSGKTRLRSRKNRWLNPRFYKEIFAHGPRGV